MRWRGRHWVVVLAGLIAACGRGGLEPRGPQAARINDVTTTMTILTVIVAVIVVAAWLWAMFSGGKSDLADPSTRRWGGSSDEASTGRRVVIGGGIVMPGVVLFTLFILGVWMTALSPQQGDIEVEVVGHQYWWEVTYLDVPGASEPFETANEVRVPVDTEVTVQLRSDDVIHSFWVPELAGKMDLVPGRDNRMTFSADEAGTYNGYCAEFCGLSHAWMKFKVIAMEPGAFADWVANEAADANQPTDQDQRAGHDVFLEQSCVGCHAITGVAGEGELGPDLTHLANRAQIGAGILDLDEDNLRAWITNARDVKGGAQMPPQDLSDQDLDHLVAYLLSLD